MTTSEMVMALAAMSSITLSSTRIFKGRRYHMAISVPCALNIPANTMITAGLHPLAFRHGSAIDLSTNVTCPKCGEVFRSDSDGDDSCDGDESTTSTDNRGVEIKTYSFSLKSKCTSSRNHFGRQLVVGVVLPIPSLPQQQVIVTSLPVTILAKEKKNKKKDKASVVIPIMPHPSASSDSSSSSSSSSSPLTTTTTMTAMMREAIIMTPILTSTPGNIRLWGPCAVVRTLQLLSSNEEKEGNDEEEEGGWEKKTQSFRQFFEGQVPGVLSMRIQSPDSEGVVVGVVSYRSIADAEAANVAFISWISPYIRSGRAKLIGRFISW